MGVCIVPDLAMTVMISWGSLATAGKSQHYKADA
jgi:hypothetical protein